MYADRMRFSRVSQGVTSLPGEAFGPAPPPFVSVFRPSAPVSPVRHGRMDATSNLDAPVGACARRASAVAMTRIAATVMAMKARFMDFDSDGTRRSAYAPARSFRTSDATTLVESWSREGATNMPKLPFELADRHCAIGRG